MRQENVLQSVRRRGWLFVSIGIQSVAVRLGLLWCFTKLGMPVGWANMTSLAIAITGNFALHYALTWNDRLPSVPTRMMAAYRWVALWLVFVGCAGLTIGIKAAVVPLVAPVIDTMVPFVSPALAVLLAGVIGELVGFPINFLTADRISFGAMAHVATWFAGHIAVGKPTEEVAHG